VVWFVVLWIVFSLANARAMIAVADRWHVAPGPSVATVVVTDVLVLLIVAAWSGTWAVLAAAPVLAIGVVVANRWETAAAARRRDADQTSAR
jgi:hypothetical protein